MRKVVCSIGVSLDGFVSGPDGGLDWAPPDEELFAALVEEFRGIGAYLLGRRLHALMTVWEGDDAPARSEDELEWGRLWRAVPKVVFSRTLTSVEGSARLATRDLAAEVAHWRTRPGTGEISVGGPELLAAAAAAGLVDEYRVRVHPVVLGGGTPLFPRTEEQVDLELVESRTFRGGVVALRYRVVR